MICNTFDYFTFDSDKMESEWHSRVYVNERD